jgi:hypothetical protein
MMFTSGFSHTHWPLATSHSVWLQNRLVPNKGNAWWIPYDEVFGKLTDLSFVRVFRSQAYAFVDPSLRKKLAPRAKDMLYVGHQEHGSHYARTQALTPLSGLPSSDPVQVRLLTDSDWGQCKNSKRSVSGNLVTIGSSPVSWQSKRQHTVALSTCEAEYMAMEDGAKESVCGVFSDAVR